MRKTVLVIVATLIILCGCAGGNNNNKKLPDVVTHTLNENEKSTSEITIAGFNLKIYKTFAEVTSYSGTETKVAVPSSAAGIPVRRIAEEAFKNDSKIVKITLPETLYIIDRYAFSGCTALEIVELNSGLEKIGDWAFYQSSVRKCDLPDSVSTLGKYCFYGTNIETVKIPSNLSEAGKYCFYGCKNLKTVEFSERFSVISERMFYNCTSLEPTMIIPKTVLEIEGYAFSGCTSLEKIVIPSETAKIGEGVFFGCSSLTVLTPSGSEAAKCAEKNKYNWESVNYDEYTEQMP